MNSSNVFYMIQPDEKNKTVALVPFEAPKPIPLQCLSFDYFLAKAELDVAREKALKKAVH